MKKIIVITGASSGMGREFVDLIVKNYTSIDEIWLIARRENVLKEISEQYKERMFKILALDLEQEASWMQYADALQQEKPKIMMLINAAGYGVIGQTREIDVHNQTGMIRLNCEALEAITQISIPYLKRGSRIIQLASASAFLPQPGFNVYAASKAFVVHYSRALARELKKDGISVTTVCPGPVQTEFFERAEVLKKSPSYKKYFRASKEKVVKKALRDAKKKKEVSVYGISIKAIRLAAKMIPHKLLLKGLYGR